MVSLRYHAPAEGVRHLASVYYLFEVEEAQFTDHERAAMAQLRFIFSGSGCVEFADGHSVRPEGAFLCGPSTAVTQFSVEGPFRMFGMGLLPCGWAAATGRPANEFSDSIHPAEELIGPAIAALYKELGRAASLEDMAVMADRALAGLARQLSPETLEFAAMVDEWLSSYGSPSVAELVERSGLSHRQLLRKVNGLYGHPPKFLARKYRALRAARAVAEGNAERLIDLEEGFYDQSHMIREIKQFAGVTPSKLRGGEGETAKLIDQRGLLRDEIARISAET